MSTDRELWLTGQTYSQFIDDPDGEAPPGWQVDDLVFRAGDAAAAQEFADVAGAWAREVGIWEHDHPATGDSR